VWCVWLFLSLGWAFRLHGSSSFVKKILLMSCHSSPDDDSVSAGRACVVGLVLGAAGLGVAVSASAAAAVQLDSVPAPRNPVSLACAVGLAGRRVIAHA
jgi:hypothetical protein